MMYPSLYQLARISPNDRDIDHGVLVQEAVRVLTICGKLHLNHYAEMSPVERSAYEEASRIIEELRSHG